jgi:fructose-1,6-bisphosphatase II
MFDPGPCVYMEKIAAGPEGGKAIDITLSIEDNIRNVAKARKMEPQDITVIVLDRDRNKESIERIRSVGARVHLIEHGDIAAAIYAAKKGTGVDLLYGIGGTPEGVTGAAAVKCLGGEIQGRLWPRNDAERKAATDQGYDLSRVLTTEDLVAGEDVYFAATGVTDGVLLEGVRYVPGGATSQSLVMRARTGTIRVIVSDHRWDKLSELSDHRYTG